jgi:hypothetical protein
MGDTYTRQSTFADGDVITAAHSNDEFNQLLAAFAASSGHTHDGTAGEGGPIAGLLANAVTIGAGQDVDIAVTFNANTNDGLLTWKEDEDYFEFNDDILIATTEKLQFRDTAIYINSSTDGQLDLVADTEIQLAATTIDINGDVDISGTANLDVVDIDGAVNIAAATTVATNNKIQFRDTGIFLNSSADGQLDIVADTEIQIASTTIDINGAVDVSGNLSVGGDLDVTGSFDMSDANITNIGSIALDTITNDGTDITLDSSGDIILDAGGNNVIVKSGGTSILDIANNSTDVELTVSTADKNFKIKGTDGASAITALDIDMALAGKATFNGDVVVTGDLTISGDDLVMGTNTAGHILVADGTNFNPTAVGDLSEISTVANDDVFLAVDTSGGGLKKITRSAVVSGLATSSAISNVVEDTTPQLGGNLDMNGADIVTTSNATLDLAPNGTGTVVVRGNTNSGAIVFNCESNSHGQKVFGQPHSAAVTNTLMLPAGANSTLVSLVSTDTLTNKTLTSPKINEDVAVTSTATELNLLDGVTSTTAELNILDGVTSTAAELNALDGITAVVGELNALDLGATAVGTAIASKAVILDSNKDYTGIRNFTVSGELDAATGDFSGDVDVDGTLEADAITIGGTAIASVLSPVAGSSSIVTTGALNAGSITSGFGAIDNGASAITTTGVITGGTLEATTDTAAGDNAAIGYTSAEGLILTGQGSTSDVVIKNDADATVVSIATGTTILTMADDVFVTGRAAGTMTTDNDGSLDLAVSNNFKVTTGGDLTLTLTNPAIGQSGNILFINASNHTISAHASLLINADVLTAISASGSYHLTYYATATSGNNTILVSASAILT